MVDFLMLNYLWTEYLDDYLLLYGEKISFFKQHDLWKFRELLIRLFDYPETIKNFNTFCLDLLYLKKYLKLKGGI